MHLLQISSDVERLASVDVSGVCSAISKRGQHSWRRDCLTWVQVDSFRREQRRVRGKSSEGKKTMVGLVTREEFNAFPRDFANVRTAVSFLDEIRCIDVKESHVHGA